MLALSTFCFQGKRKFVEFLSSCKGRKRPDGIKSHLLIMLITERILDLRQIGVHTIINRQKNHLKMV